jgi:hypothetical protein
MALIYLRQVPAEIATDLRRARTINHPDLRLDTFFFGCLGLAKSAFQKTLAAMIPFERSNDADTWMYQPQQHYAAVGIGRPVSEHKNPDGNIVSSYEGLQGTMCLYIEIASETCEASSACERFMGQLSSLLDVVGLERATARPT